LETAQIQEQHQRKKERKRKKDKKTNREPLPADYFTKKIHSIKKQIFLFSSALGSFT